MVTLRILFRLGELNDQELVASDYRRVIDWDDLSLMLLMQRLCFIAMIVDDLLRLRGQK